MVNGESLFHLVGVIRGRYGRLLVKSIGIPKVGPAIGPALMTVIWCCSDLRHSGRKYGHYLEASSKTRNGDRQIS